MRYFISVILFSYLFSCSGTQKNISRELYDAKYPIDKNSYQIFYFDKEGIKILNTHKQESKLLVKLNKYLVQSKISPNNKLLAFSYLNNDSVFLNVLDFNSLKIWNIKNLTKEYIFTFGWSPNSKSLGIGYYTQKKIGEKYYPDKGDIIISSFDGKNQNRLGCSASKIFKYWLPNGNYVVSDGKYLYGVLPSNCKTIFKMAIADKNSLTFSPNGKKIFYTKFANVYYENLGQNNKVPELYLADFNGKNSKKIINYKAVSRNYKWSPVNDIIAMDVESQNYSDIRHLAFYDITKKKLDIFSGQAYNADPKVEKPHWSPNGKKIFYEKTFAVMGYTEKWFDKYTEILDLVSKNANEISHGKIYPSIPANNKYVGTFFSWLNDDSVILYSPDWIKIYNYPDNSTFTQKLSDFTLLAVIKEKNLNE